MGLYSLNVYFIPPVFPFAKKNYGKDSRKTFFEPEHGECPCKVDEVNPVLLLVDVPALGGLVVVNAVRGFLG